MAAPGAGARWPFRVVLPKISRFGRLLAVPYPQCCDGLTAAAGLCCEAGRVLCPKKLARFGGGLV